MNDDVFVCVRSLQWNGLYIIIFQIPIHLMNLSVTTWILMKIFYLYQKIQLSQ